MNKLVVPIVNSNGNTGEDLVEKLRLASIALMQAQEAMIAAHDVVHGRNFQTLPGGGRSQQQDAVHAWRERMAMLAAIRQDVLELAIAIHDQTKPFYERMH